ncbi:unnamed protein product [Cyprideis torosa]|uniref:Ribosomal RNA-processing protein 12-like conserved domain-containing protein n=1 Tax=Cyprideis torosa TaxID=163714 RepID=A0A7R8WCZ4_9CRUS|nr:unnamed protein product [Cyprideis torosa]CAG0888855.1 unnamed protein product [Cyprideis torosa]
MLCFSFLPDQILNTTHSHKIVSRASRCLEHISRGLVENQALSIDQLLILAHGLASESIPDLSPPKASSVDPSPSPATRFTLRPEDCRIIPPEPGRVLPQSKKAVRTNAHVLVTLGLEVLHALFKKELLSPESKGNAQHKDRGIETEKMLKMLDPFVPLLVDCLKAQPQPKLLTLSLRILIRLCHLPLPSLEKQAEALTKTLFALLGRFAGPTSEGRGETTEMVMAAFKLMSLLLRDLKSLTLEPTQLRVLLLYVERDLFSSDSTRESSAFTLLKAILSRRISAPEVASVMQKTKELSVTSLREHVRTQSRQALLMYLLEYPLGFKKIVGFLQFFLAQLEYEYEEGRIAALEMMNGVFQQFPPKLLRENASLFVISLAPRMVVDDSAKCRQMAALCIRTLLDKLSREDRDRLMQMTMDWLQAEKASVRRMAVQLISQFLAVEKASFSVRLEAVVSQLIASLGETKEGGDPDQDPLAFHVLNAVLKLFHEFSSLAENDDLWGMIFLHLIHPHSWVRLASSKLFGQLLAATDPETLAQAICSSGGRGQRSYLLNSSPALSLQRTRQLLQLSVSQFQREEDNQAVMEQVVKNLVQLSRVLCAVESTGSGGSDGPDLSFRWLALKLKREAAREVAKEHGLNPKTIKREWAMKWAGGVAVSCPVPRWLPSLPILLAPLVREAQLPRPDPALHRLATEATDLIRAKVKGEDFAEAHAEVVAQLATKRGKRKAERASEAVTHPEKAARMRIMKQRSKKEARKRKREAEDVKRQAITAKKRKQLKNIAILQE